MSSDGFKERYNYVKDNWLRRRKEKVENDKMISETKDSQLSNNIEEIIAKKKLINAQNIIRKQ